MNSVKGLALEMFGCLEGAHEHEGMLVQCRNIPGDLILTVSQSELPDGQKVYAVFTLFDHDRHSLKVFVTGRVNIDEYQYLIFGEVAEETSWEGTQIKKGEVVFGKCNKDKGGVAILRII